jgi:hypothetical protein
MRSHSRGALRPSFVHEPPSPNQRARGMPGDGLTHGPPATRKAGGSHHRFSRLNRHSLRDGFNGFLRALPRDRAFLPLSPARRENVFADLAPASGRQDHTTSPSAPATFVRRAIRVHRTPASRVVTIGRNVPLHRGGMRESIGVICPTPQALMRAADRHDGQFGHEAHAGVVCRAVSA